MKTACLGVCEMKPEVETVAGLEAIVPEHTAENFKRCVVQCLADFGLSESDVLVALTDNCGKEAGAATLMDTAHPADTCRNHTLALCVGYSLGSKLAKRGVRVARNNTAGAALLKRKRKLAAHFHHSAKATANLKELQIAELLKPNPAFPFDRPADSLTKKRRRR